MTAFVTGQPIVAREILREGPWLGHVAYVVADTDEALITYLPTGAPFGFPPGPWPTPDGRHPWQERGAWTGHGPLMVHPVGQPYSIWHFWSGPARRFEGWYVNLQEPWRRTAIGYDTQDLELDIWVRPDGTWSLKDAELVQTRVDEGRFTPAQAEMIRATGADLCRRLDGGERFWDPDWVAWEPPADWGPRPLPDGWERVAHACV